MKRPPHRLLARQLRRLGLDGDGASADAERLRALVGAVDRRYVRFDAAAEAERRAHRSAADFAQANRMLRNERDTIESRLRERTAQLEQSRGDLLEAQLLAGLGSWSYRRGDAGIEVSSQLVSLLGVDPAAPPSSLDALLDHVVDADRESAQRALVAALRQPQRLTGELRLRDARGEVRWFANTIASQADADGRIVRVRGTMLDVTARRLAETRVQRLAYHDDLTGLPNRAAFMEDAAEAVAQARLRGSRLALLFLDLDGFKEINDSLGHDAGDELLQQVAGRIRACLRQADRLARFGGDEFLVLIDPMRRRRDVQTVTRKILQAVATPLKLDGLTATVSASIGIALFPDDGDDPRRLLKNADAAMYQAKQGGRNALRFYAPQINASLREKIAMINDLRAAVAGGELGLAYQPIVEGHSGRLLGLEALARWDHAERGPVAPGVFVPLAEETGLIGSIGAMVLARACAQMVAWDTDRTPDATHCERPYVSVNVSPVQLFEDGFVRDLRLVLADVGLPAARLQLELTEGTVMKDPERAARVLGELSTMGVRIALDDFGTGHSSLAYLRTFPIHCIKIDRVFVLDLGRDARHGAIVPAIVAIAQSLGAGVVAEGVESESQREALIAMGCREMQGYLFSRPLPAEEWGGRFLGDPAAAGAG